MAEYIEREAVLALKKPFPTSKDSVTLYQQYFISPTAVETIPAADVVPVVRCKDCEYSANAWVNENGFLICPASGMEITDNDFCSYGARMDLKDGDGE